jgi:hypothetical protein
MVLNEILISQLLEKPQNSKAIAEGATLQKNHKHHITGEGYKELVWKVEGYEATKDYDNVKKQVAKPATIEITSIILDNLNRWLSAQGTVKKADFKNPDKDKRFQEVLNQVWHGTSFEDFLSSFVKEAIYTEFNGFVLVDKPFIEDTEIGKIQIREGIKRAYNEENLDPYLIFLSIGDIHDYYLWGDRVEYLIIKLDDKKKRFRIIDDEKDIIIDRTNDNKFSVVTELKNELGYVPARMISSINATLLDNQVKTSPIDHIIPALDRYASCDADLRMQYIRHCYPKLAIVTKECTRCGGAGKYADDANRTEIVCQNCNGSGKEIPISRDGVIGLPASLLPGDSPYPGAPATYISPDVESLRAAAEDLEKQRLDILYAGTGDKNIIAESMNTATENMINSRSLEDRIAEISRMIEQLETFLKKAIKDLHKEFASISDYEITVKYGKKIVLKNESELMKDIEQAKKSGMNYSYIQELQAELIYSKYKNNSTQLERMLLLNDIEPFAGFTLGEVLQMRDFIDPKELRLKANFEALVDQLEASEPIQLMIDPLGYKAKANQVKARLLALIPEPEPEPIIENV